MGSEWRDIAAVLRERPKTVDISTHLAEALGYRPEELLGQHVNDVLAPRSAIRLIEDGISAEVWRTGVIQDVPVVYQHRDGHAIPARISVYVDEAEGVAIGVAHLADEQAVRPR